MRPPGLPTLTQPGFVRPIQRLLPRALGFALVLSLSACDGNDPGGADNGGADNGCADGSMTATAGGRSFDAECIQLDVSGNLLTLGGVANADGSDGAMQRAINLAGIPAEVGAHTPTVATYGNVNTANPSDSETCAASPIPGAGGVEVVVEEITESGARGTFAFTALCPSDGSSVQVTSGKFDVSN